MSPVSTSYKNPPTATVSGISGWERTFCTSSCSRATWSSMTPKDCHEASWPLDVEQVGAEHQRLERLRGDPTAGVPEDLRVTWLQSEHAERVDPGVHAGHHRDTRVCDSVEAAELEGGGELAVRIDEVVEVLGHSPQISELCSHRERVPPPRPGRTRGSTGQNPRLNGAEPPAERGRTRG
jgi:hypothetical protein